MHSTVTTIPVARLARQPTRRSSVTRGKELPLTNALPPHAFERAMAGILDVVTNASWLAVLTLVATVAAVTYIPELMSERLLRDRH